MTDEDLKAKFSHAFATVSSIPCQELQIDALDLNTIQQAEIAAGIHDPKNLALRVKWGGALREAVKHRCPTNKVGTPLVSDIDRLCATPREKAIAFINTVTK